MPTYKVNGSTFTIPDNEVDLFESDFPKAELQYQTNDGNKFTILASERKDFLSDFPDATELGWESTKKEEAKKDDSQKADPFDLAAPLYGSASYQDNIGKPEDYNYYPSPLSEEGKADFEPMSPAERSKQEYDMLMRQLNDFNAQNRDFMDTYEAYEKAARHQVNEGGFALDTMEREYINANSNDYHLRKQERDALNDRIKNNSYFNLMREQEAVAATEAADSIANLAARERVDNHKLDLQYNLWNMQHLMPYSTGPSVQRALTPEALEHGEAQADLQAAERLYRKTAEIYAAPINNGEDILKNFAVGAGQRADDLDFWTLGLSAIADDVNTRQAFQKIQDKLGSVKNLGDLTDKELDELLTPSEQLLINAYMDNIQAMAARQDNTSGAYKAGQGAADSAMFMAQFLLTGGIGEAATTGTQVHKNVVNWLGRKLSNMNSGLLKDVTRGAVKLGVGTAESVGKALVMTPLMPHTYANIADKLMSFDDKGELMDVTDAILSGAADSLIETWSESTGDFVNKVLGIPGGIVKGASKKVLKNVDFSDWANITNAPMMKILRKGGFNGFLGEMGEEFIGNAVRSISGLDPNAFKEFAQLENLLVTAGSFAPMTVFGIGTSSAQYGFAKRKLANAQKVFEEVLRNNAYTEDQIKFTIDELLATTDAHLTPEKLVQNFSPILRELAYNDHVSGNSTNSLEAAADFLWNIARYRTFDGIYHRQEEQQRRDMLAEIQEGTGREFWTTRLSENAGLDGTAYETDEVRAVEFNDGRVAYVLGGDGVTNTVVYNDGQTGFLSAEQLNEGKANGTIVSDSTMNLDDYLTQQVARVRMTEEEQRMFAERNDNTAQIRAQFPMGATVQLGTAEAPIEGIVRQQTPDGAIVESPNGVSVLTWEELGHTIGVEVNPQTDAQMDEEAINNLEIADLQRRRAREQRRVQANTQTEVAMEEEELVDEAENEGLEHPIPLKADGSVDQTAFWNESPARWAQWKTEQRQDGGAYASTYIQNAINILEGQIAESEAAFLAEADFDAKDALEQTISQQRARLAELQNLTMQYMPAAIPAEATAEQAQPGTETSPATEVMAERQKFELDAEYQRRLSLARALAEKEMILKEYFDAISAGSMEAVVMNKQNYKQVMKEMGCDETDIEMVTNAIKFAEEENKAVNALHVKNKIFVIAEYNTSVEQGRISYVHERQHNITKNRPEFIQRILSLGIGREKLQEIVRKLSGTHFYDNESDNVLADEILSSTMEIAYTYDDFSVTLSKLGLPIELINVLNEINDEQRKDYTLVNARRNSNELDSRQRDSRQDVGDQVEVSGELLGEEGVRSSENSERGAEAAERGEPAEGGAEASDEGLQVPVAEVEEISDDDTSSAEAILEEDGFEVDEQNEDVRFSVRYLPTPDQREGIIDSIVAVTGRTRDEAERWLDSELSLASIVLNDKEYLDYAPDAKYKAIKDNSDYPQGTVDFNNICRKRKDFTSMYTRLQRSYPNRIFTAEDLADIRTIMSEDGLTVACGLCYVEDRRQKLGEVASAFIEDLQDGFRNYAKKGATKKANAVQFTILVNGDNYIPSIYDLITLEGSDKLYEEHRGIWDAFGAYNRARGQQTQNTFQGYAEYKREILTWSEAKVKKVNSLGGLRIFSYSDFEAHHLLDIIQIIIDCAARGVMIQGYTKVPEFARVVEKTGIKLNRSLIPLGDTGIVDGKLAYDPVEGIDINDPNFLESNDNVGNILIGINDEQIRMAMADPFIHYIIPYHARQAGNIRAKLNVGAWTNYIDTQNERKMSDGKRVEKNINIYTDVLNESITNDREFVEKYLEVCRQKEYIPKFDQFLDMDAEGNYVYTPGYYKFLVDFKLFDETGNILPQKAVVAEFDDAFNAQVLNDYAREERETTGNQMNSTYDKIVETLDLGEPTEGEDVQFRTSEGPIDILEEARKIVEREDGVAFRVISDENYEMAQRIINNLAGRPYFQRLEGEYELGKLASNYAELADIIMAIDANKNYTPVGTALLGFFAENPEMHYPLLFNDSKLGKETSKAFAEELSKVNDPYALFFMKEAWRIHKGSLEQAGLGVKPSSTTKFNKAVDARAEEIKAAEVKGTAFNFKKQESSLDEIDAVFKQLNKDPELALLHDRVMSVARTLGVKVSFAGKRGSTAGESLGDKVSYDYKFFNSPAVSDQKKCNTITHELIHSITVYAIYLRSKAPSVLSDGMLEAVDILHDVYNQIARDPAFKGEYGVSDVYEMVAELSNAQFRDKLKEKNLFQRILDALKRLLGIDTIKEDSAYQVLSDTLNYIIDNYDQAAFDAYALYASKNKSYGRMMKIEEAPSFRITPEMDKAYMNAVEAGDMETAQRMVIEAAKIAMPNTKVIDKDGNPKIVMHLSSDEFTKFGEGINTNVVHSLGFFTDELEGLQDYHDKFFPEGFAYKCFLNFENPKVVDFKGQPYWRYKDESTGEELTTDLVAARTKREGKHDGLIMLNVGDELAGNIGDEINDFVPFIPSQIKSAEPVTYDNDGNVIPLSQRFNPENEDIRFSIRSEEQREKLFEDAKAHYGVTKNFNAAGYMLPDGSLLDFSEANDGGDPNSRSLDHRDIEGVIMDNGVEYDSRWMYIADFMKEGAIRLLPESAGINMIQAPTEEQRKKIFDFIYKYNGEVILEINDERLNSVVYMEYDRRTSPSRIFRDIDGYFNDGIVPQQDIRFRMSNENQAIFVSNAAKAVEGIKQEKATPEQWLKMIEKNGGLKAGEDKWMGLSDWLKASDKKTLTKQEVLDYINENMIIIEEQHYSDEEVAASANKELNEKYPGWEEAFSMDWDSYMDEPYASIWDNETAVELYNNNHENQIELDEDGEFENLDDESKVMDFGKELAEIYYRGNSDVRPIHGTRSGYQTRGLSDNHEIALTVPTIERWKADDAVHFGDAGDGRAIAWIRFGETKYRPAGIADEIAALDKAILEYEGETSDEEYKALVDKKHALLRASRAQKVLVIDEIQSNRHQEGREKGYTDTERLNELRARQKEIDVEIDALAKDVLDGNRSAKRKQNLLFKERRDLDWEIAQVMRKGVPAAPFEKNWQELAMKRMLRYAAENGFDIIAWTTGDQQANRYDLSRDVIKISAYRPNAEGERIVTIYYRDEYNDYKSLVINAEGKVIQGDYNGSALADVVGKEMALQIMNAEDVTEFKGDGLKVGGEGMRGFYDKMLPAFMNKYGKKWGVKVEDIDLPNLGKSGYTMHSIPVTEEMKASVMEGQVMFRVRGAEESAVEFHEAIIAEYKKNHAELAPIYLVDINDRQTIADIFGITADELSEDVYNEFVRDYNSGNSGYYQPGDNDYIVIFAQEDMKDSRMVDETLFHENMHAILTKIDSTPIRLGKYLYENPTTRARAMVRDMVEASYKPHEYHEEMLTNWATPYMATGYGVKLLNSIPVEYKPLLQYLFNTLKYEPEREELQRRSNLQQSTRGTGVPRVSWTVSREERGANSDSDLRFRTTEITPEVRDEMAVIAATALVNGNYMKAPNGADTNLTAEQWAMVRTKNFLRWFGDWINDPENASKVVDENGEPKVVYHGTPWNPLEEPAGTAVFKSGWFTGMKRRAEGFGEPVAVFLNIKNPAYSYDKNKENDSILPDGFDLNHTSTFGEYDGYISYVDYPEVPRVSEFAKRRIMMMNPENYEEVISQTLAEMPKGQQIFSAIPKDSNQIKSATDNTGEFSEGEDDIRFSIRTKPAPEKTGIGYKVFYLKDGKLYPPMVANLGGVDTPVGVWLDAEEGTRAGVSKTGRPKVKQGGKGTQGGSGTLAYRPGWHLGEIPYAIQFNRKDENGNRTLFPADFVWAEVEYANDVNYQEEAMSYGMNANGKFQHSLAGLPKLPTDGSYRYRTNPNPETDPWIITGAMKVNRLLTPSKVDQMVIDAGREPQKRQEGAVTDEQIEALNKELGLVENKVSFRVNENPTEAQKEAGNYKMGHLNLDGYRITIENPKGSIRRGTDSKGNSWENTLNNDYGYIRGTEGVDGDHIDVYLSDNPSEGNVFVIDQVNPQTREFDEHKVMYGFNSAEEAREAYLANFSEGWNGLGTITEVSKDEFKKWIQSSHRKTKPFSEYKSVNAIGMQSEGISEEVMTGTPTEEVVASGLSLSPAQLASLAGDIFAALPEESRKKITDGLNGNIFGLQDAILQIPTSLAMKESWNEEDKAMADVVAAELTKMAGEMTRPFSASEGLWVLYNALNPASEYDILSQASRALVQRNLGFDPETLQIEDKGKEGVRFRTVGDARINATASLYNRGAVNVWTRIKESFVDMNASVEKLVKAIEKMSGKKAQGFENILMTLNQQSSRGLAAMEAYEQKFLNKMFDEIRKIMDKTDFKYDDIVRYVILKHGLERNIKLAQRDAKAHYQEIYDDIIAKIKGMNPAQKRTYLTNAQLRDADAKAELARLQAVNTSVLTPDQLTQYKKDIAKAKKEATEAAEHLVRAQKIATFTEQDALDELDKIFKKIEKGTDSVYKEMRKNDYSGISSMFYDTLGVNRKDYETEEEYQAALMQAKADKYDNLGDIEGAAQMEVTLFENAMNTDNLWKSINKATKETLRQQYEANMISKDQYENLRNMFEFYVPLRGFKDNTAEDMYTYYRRPNSTGYTKPILGAEGRKTEAESPFGWIAAMAGSAIASNVKNEAKLALYYFVANRPDNGVATLSRTWFVHTPGDVDANGKKIFRPAYPPFSEDLSTDAAKQAYEDWQEQMRDLQKQGLAYEAGQRLNLGNAVVNISDTNKPEHIVNVKVGGKDYTIVINGNPRAAQAINGDLNIEASQDYNNVIIFGPFLRWMSSVNTSYNPEFWITNLMRDMAFTWMAVNTKEDPAYRRKFSKNYRKAFKVIGLVAKNEKGMLGNKYIEQMYQDFVKYGGVTGYTQIKDNETWEKEIEKYIKSNAPDSTRLASIMKGTKDAFHALHRFGESLEQVSRFAAFLTSREMGKSVPEAINDAKEITVNFNRKGSGKMITLEEAKYLTGRNGRPLSKPEQWAAVAFTSISPLGRRFIMFFNAAIQGLNATYKLWKKNPSRFGGWALAYTALGVMNATIHALIDDDDDYLDMPQYERRTSLMIGYNGAYLKWALPQEAKAFYALGDLAVESIMGRNPHQNVLGEAAKIVTELSPINPTEGVRAFLPSIAIPAVELALNKDYKGDPIYNDQKWLSEEEKKRTAKWSKAYSGTGKIYVDIAKGLNALTGGDEYDAGLINLQPEKIQHIVQSAFGGTIRTADKFVTTVMAAIDPEEDVTMRQFPFLNRILTINDERFKNVHVNDVYDYYKADAEHALTLEKQYKKNKDKDALNDLRESDEYQWAKIYKKYKKPLEKIQEKIKVAEGTAERKDLMKQQDQLKKDMIKEISELP